MGFYLESGKNTTYISDSYLRRELLNNNKLSEATVQMLDSSEEVLLKKLGVEIPIVSVDEMLKTFTDLLSKDNIDKLSVLLNFNRSHLLAVFYLYYSARISLKDIEQIISASSYQTRSELLLSYLNEQDSESINIIMPLLELIRKLSNYKNKYELSSIGYSKETALNKLKNSKLSNKSYTINQGNYFYENFSRNDGKSLLEKCDRWKGIKLPDDNDSKRVFPRSGTELSTFETMSSNLGNGSFRGWEMWLNEGLYNPQKLFNSSPSKYAEVATASLRFGKWWHKWWASLFSKGEVTIGSRFTDRTINVDRGRVEEDTLSSLLGNQLILRYQDRLPSNRKIDLPSENIINNTIKEAFRVNFNHGLRKGIAKNDIENYDNDDYNNDGLSDTIVNIFSVYDQLILGSIYGSDRKRYYRLKPKITNYTLTNNDAVNTPLHLSGDAIGDITAEIEVSGTGLSPFKYTEHTGYIDLFREDENPTKARIEIANSLSDITNVKYSINDSGELIKENTGLYLENHYFIKNHLSYIPFDFDFTTDDLNFESLVTTLQFKKNGETIIKSLSSLLENWVSSIYNFINMSKNSIYSSYSSPKFYDLTHLLKYDYLIDDNGKFVNFGTTDFYSAITKLLNQNNISPQFSLMSIQNDPYGTVNIFKQYIDSINFTPSSNDEKFITSIALDMLKKYIDYLLDPENDDIESVLIVDNFYNRLYKLLFVYRHSILLLPEIRRAVSSTAMYNRLMNDPFRDRDAIDRINNFYKKYKESYTVKHHREQYDINFSTLSDMYVGSFSNSSLMLSWSSLLGKDV